MTTKNKICNYKVLTGDWWVCIKVDTDIFDDPYIEACTRAIETRAQTLNSEIDLNVHPVMVCKNLDDIKLPERYINTYKILINAGMPARASLLREVFLKSLEVDFASEPISSSLKRM